MSEQDGLWDAIIKLEDRIKELERENDTLRREVDFLRYTTIPELERKLQYEISDEVRRAMPSSRGW